MIKKVLFYVDKYRALGVPIGFILVALFIIFVLIIPGISSIGSLNERITEENKKLADYNASAAVLKSLSEAQLSQQVELATKALPASKDIGQIYLALVSSSAKANIFISGFSVKVGDIFQKDDSKKESISGVPYITVNVTVSRADLKSLYDFSQELSKQSPLNNSVKATLSSGEGNVDIEFYYKPYDLTVLKNNIVKPLSKDELTILQNLVNQQSN